MVFKGKGKFPKPKQANRKPPTPNITKIASLSKQSTPDKALDLLHDIARLTAPIMHHYNFKVGLLCEMYPKNGCLLGLNVNHGQKICIRLRSPTNCGWFLPMEELIGTMLHELTHNIFGKHDNRFYKKLEELKDKFYEVQTYGSLIATGYANEQQRLGKGTLHGFSVREGRLKKLSEVKYVGKIQKLGGTKINVKSKSPRELMREAAERRLEDNKTCIEEDTKADNDVIPSDNDLTIIEVIDLDSDEDKDFEKNKRNFVEERSDTVRKKVKKEQNDDLKIIVLD